MGSRAWSVQNAQRIRLRQYVYFLRYWLERRCQPLWCAWKSFPRVASILLSWSSPAKSVLQIASKSFFCKSARINYWFIYIGNWLNSLILPLARWFWEFFCKSTWVARILLSWSSSAKSVLHIASKSTKIKKIRLARWFWAFFSNVIYSSVNQPELIIDLFILLILLVFRAKTCISSPSLEIC